MKKSFFTGVLCAVFTLVGWTSVSWKCNVSAATPSYVEAKAECVMEVNSRRILYEARGDLRLPMASTTKVLTAITVLELCQDISEEVVIPQEAVGIEGSSVYLKSGEELTVRALLYALMLRSANDAAAALAYSISGSIEDFSLLMNKKAEELGLTDTNFENPHGLDSKNHYTTATDLARLTAYALKNPIFKEITSTYKTVIDSSLQSRLLINHNKLLSSYQGCIGVKTGYTRKSGRSLVSAAERDGIMLIAVTINAPDDWKDHTRLLDYGFSLYQINNTTKI